MADSNKNAKIPSSVTIEPDATTPSTIPAIIPAPSIDSGEIPRKRLDSSSKGLDTSERGEAAPLRKSRHVKNKPSTVIPIIPAEQIKINNSEDGSTSDRIRLGICAMDKKARSKPMAEILSRLDESLFHVIFFGDDVILNKPIEVWPVCDVLIAFYSKNYPLMKCRDYVELTKPFILNDLKMQDLLKDRRKVYDLLEASGIDVPRHVYLSKDGYVSTGTGDGNGNKDREVVECDDHIEVNGVSIHKPFVEKPVDADDHNIAIYYPTSAGGGCKKLFRKIGNRSSEFYPDINEVRRDGSYIYEEFVETQGTDVKMYTVGPEYGHAEARKSPAVDGKVQRNPDGKEVRFPVILTQGEKEIARRIVLGFKQFVCGFDLLRVQEGHSVVSYVCDVNGWSFVKNSRKYYDDCAQILTEHILAAVKPNSLKGFSTLDPLIIEDDHSFFQPSATLSRVARLLKGEPDVPPPAQTLSPARSDQSNPPNAATTLVEGAVRVRDLPNELTSEPASMCASSASSMDGETQKHVNKPMQRVDSSLGAHQEELRCVISVVRHGDRTPKQKLKVNITEPSILSYFQKHCVKPTKDLKVKAKAPMIEFLNTVRTILADKAKEKETGQDKDVDPDQKKKEKKLHNQLLHMRDILERWKFTGLNRKLQIKPRDWDQDEETGKKTCKEVQLVLKWGGNLTKLGENQAIRLGQRFRQEMYPDSSGGGILRLHSTFRHDMKIKTSDEGRVMKTAAAFAKGLLELEGEIPPILVSLVHKEKDSMHMLDPSGDKDAKLELDECKERITAHLQGDKDWREMTEEDRKLMVGPEEITSMRDSLAEVGNPRRTLMEIYRSMGYLIDQLEEMLGMMGSGDEKRIEGGEGLKGDDENDVVLSGVKLYKGETLLELTERWRFIHKRLYDPDEDTFDLSRIPDVHDNVRFDVLHNPHLGLSSTLEKLYELAKSMADCVVPQEYGTTIAEKRSVGINICSSLLEKIRYDLNIARTDNKADMRYMINMDYSADLPINTMGRRIRSRLYFTSESHLHTMLNVLRFAGVDENHSLLSEAGLGIINNTRELCYLTQIVIRLFEDTSIPLGDPKRFRAEILFSPGATATPLHMHDSLKIADTTRLDTAPLEVVGKDGLTCQEIEEFFGSAILESGSKVDDSASKASTVELGGCAPMGASFYNPNPPIPKLVENTEQENDELPGPLPIPEGTNGHKELPTDNEESFLDTDRQNTERTNSLTRKPPMMKNSCLVSLFQGPEEAPNANGYESPVLASTTGSSGGEPAKEEKDADNSPKKIDDEPHKELDSKYFWSTVAIGTMLLGASCLIMAMSLTGDSRNRRRYTRR